MAQFKVGDYIKLKNYSFIYNYDGWRIHDCDIMNALKDAVLSIEKVYGKYDFDEQCYKLKDYNIVVTEGNIISLSLKPEQIRIEISELQEESEDFLMEIACLKTNIAELKQGIKMIKANITELDELVKLLFEQENSRIIED